MRTTLVGSSEPVWLPLVRVSSEPTRLQTFLFEIAHNVLPLR
jgi:hypothetical protein